jgi:hypothetical protein
MPVARIAELVTIVIRLRARELGFNSRQVQEISVQTSTEAHPVSYPVVVGALS